MPVHALHITSLNTLHSSLQAELGGKKGLVPSNFLEETSLLNHGGGGGGVEVFAADEEVLRRAEEIIQKVCALEWVQSSMDSTLRGVYLRKPWGQSLKDSFLQLLSLQGSLSSSSGRESDGGKKSSLISRGKGLLSIGKKHS